MGQNLTDKSRTMMQMVLGRGLICLEEIVFLKKEERIFPPEKRVCAVGNWVLLLKRRKSIGQYNIQCVSLRVLVGMALCVTCPFPISIFLCSHFDHLYSFSIFQTSSFPPSFFIFIFLGPFLFFHFQKYE